MRRKMKRMLAIAMSVVLAAGMAGCGQKPSEEVKTDNGTEAQEAAGTGKNLKLCAYSEIITHLRERMGEQLP